MRKLLPSANSPTGAGGSLPAPVGGWNARDPIANMPQLDAVFLDNFFPRTSDVQLRKGSALVKEFVDLPTESIRSLLGYKTAQQDSTLFAATESGIYCLDDALEIEPSPATNNVWQSVNIATAGGFFLWACCGDFANKARYFDGGTWTELDTTSTPALTGITSSAISNVSLFKSRLIFCASGELGFYFLPVDSVAGAAQPFPLGAIFRQGGELVATDTWTLDGGNGPEDYFVAMTSEGELALYAGTDPGNASAWSLKGVYYIGKPIGKRCFVKFGGDLCVLTVQGLYPLSKALLSAAIDRRAAISDKISRAWVDYTETYKGLFGWQPVVFPEATMLLVNVPVLYSQEYNTMYSYQFVMNTQTGAWCRFVGMPSEVWAVHDGKLYYALHNKVYEAWTGTEDATGFPIEGRFKTAFQYLSGRGASSRITMVKPILVSSTGNLKIQLGLDTDYSEGDFLGTSISYLNNLAVWDQSNWDEAAWSGSSTIAKWRTVSHRPGRATAIRLRIQAKGVSMAWNALDFVLQRGGLM